MASLLIRLLLLIVVLWSLRTFLARIFGASPRRPAPGENASNNMVKDPVCGMYMDSRLAVRIENRKEAHYFCSEECKNKYMGKSADAGSSSPPPM
jgi:uncharacterized protein